MKSRALAVLLALIGVWCFGHDAGTHRVKAQFNGCPAGFCSPLVISAYQGIGDVLSGAAAFYGTQAYSAATRGMKSLNVCNSTGGVDVGCADLSTDATAGKVVPGTVGGITCPAVSVLVCTIKTFYDGTFGTSCTGSVPCDATQPTIANRALLEVNQLGGTACAVFTGSVPTSYTIAAGFGSAYPYSVSAVVENTLSGTYGLYLVGSNGGIQLGFNNVANQVLWFANDTLSVTAAATDNAFHAIQAANNAALSNLNIDGVLTTGSLGASPQTLGNTSYISSPIGRPMTGIFCEEAAYYSDVTSSEAAINTNQHSSLRWNF